MVISMPSPRNMVASDTESCRDRSNKAGHAMLAKQNRQGTGCSPNRTGRAQDARQTQSSVGRSVVGRSAVRASVVRSFNRRSGVASVVLPSFGHRVGRSVVVRPSVGRSVVQGTGCSPAGHAMLAKQTNQCTTGRAQDARQTVQTGQRWSNDNSWRNPEAFHVAGTLPNGLWGKPTSAAFQNWHHALASVSCHPPHRPLQS